MLERKENIRFSALPLSAASASQCSCSRILDGRVDAMFVSWHLLQRELPWLGHSDQAMWEMFWKLPACFSLQRAFSVEVVAAR